MTGNVALDVSIGLVFIYLLFSLYATVLMEIIASTLGLRAKNLNYALKRMLMDEKKDAGILSRLWTTISQMWGRATNLENQKIYNRFFGQPTIRYLNNGGINALPSYISSQMFVKALIDSIKAKDSEDISLAVSIEQGLYDLRGEFIDELKRNGTLKDDNTPSWDTLDHIESLLRDANGDIVKFKILLENWYDETMSRSSGWYKRTVQIVLLILGLCIAFSFNVDTITIVKKLSRDPKVREQMVSLAKSYVDEHPEGGDSVVAKNEQPEDSKKRLEYLEKTRDELDKEIQNSQQLLGSGWHIEKSYPTYETSRAQEMRDDSVECVWKFNDKKSLYARVHASIDKRYFENHYKPNNEGVVEVKPFWYKVAYVWRHPGGFFLTMLAISLGAPFWFDILNKLVKLRTSNAIKGEPGKGAGDEKTGTKTDTLNRAG